MLRHRALSHWLHLCVAGGSGHRSETCSGRQREAAPPPLHRVPGLKSRDRISIFLLRENTVLLVTSKADADLPVLTAQLHQSLCELGRAISPTPLLLQQQNGT